MALIDCWECDTNISDAAESCPQCGAPSSSVKAQTEGIPQASLSEGVDPELHAELMEQAKISITRKKLLRDLQSSISGGVYEKHLNAKGAGKNAFSQIYWKHFSIEDHSKDKSFETHISKSVANTGHGNRYIRDVNVTTTTTNYDFLAVLNKDGEKFTYRLTDCSLSKLSSGQIVSLGWVQKSDSPLVEEKKSTDSWDIGQDWDDEIQPSIFVSHGDLKNGRDGQDWEALSSTELEDNFISNSIGMWHSLWLVPIASFFIAQENSNLIDQLIIVSGAALLLMFMAKVSRTMKANKQKKLWKSWYRSEADRMLKIGIETFKKLI